VSEPETIPDGGAPAAGQTGPVLTCRRCRAAEFKLRWQTFTDGSQHLRGNCAKCGGWVRFLAVPAPARARPRRVADQEERAGDVLLHLRPGPDGVAVLRGLLRKFVRESKATCVATREVKPGGPAAAGAVSEIPGGGTKP
jgi:hypothetical protein